MAAFTILGEGTDVPVDASTAFNASTGASSGDGPLRISPEAVERALGWELTDEGFCLGTVCYPLPPDGDLVNDEGIALAGLAALLDRPIAIDQSAGAAYLGASARERSQALEMLDAPDFTLPDLAGEMHSLSDHRGKKVLLVAYASW